MCLFLWAGVCLRAGLEAHGVSIRKDTLTGWGDVVITEIMADPLPSVKWEEEYIELYNRTERFLDLQDWRLKVGERTLRLPAGSVADCLIPGEYRVLVLSSLPNEGSSIQILNERGTLIHAVAYRSPPFAPGWKEEGGWSLESPDPDLLCNVSARWSYSCDPSGGTPGSRNCRSFKEADLSSPVFLYHGFSKSGDLFLQFSESIIDSGHRLIFVNNIARLNQKADNAAGRA